MLFLVLGKVGHEAMEKNGFYYQFVFLPTMALSSVTLFMVECSHWGGLLFVQKAHQKIMKFF